MVYDIKKFKKIDNLSNKKILLIKIVIMKYRYSLELMTFLNLSPTMMLTEYEILNYILLKCNKISHSLYQVPLNLYTILYPNEQDAINEELDYKTINKNRIRRKLKQLVFKAPINNNYVSVSNIYSDVLVNEIKIDI